MVAVSNTSGTYNFAPAISDFIIEAFERIQIFAPAIEDRHIISARRSANITLLDWSAQRGTNLWKIGDDVLTIPLVPGKATYRLPQNVVYILDTYLRQYTPSGVYATIGNPLTPMTTADGVPVLTALGEPAVLAPSSGTFDIVAGQQLAVGHWPMHGLANGAPLFFQTPVTIGPMTIGLGGAAGVAGDNTFIVGESILGGPDVLGSGGGSAAGAFENNGGFLAVDEVLDENTFTFLLPGPASVTRSGTGGTPLFVTTAGSSIVTVVLPGYGLHPGDSFPVQIPTSVGGLLLSGNYTVLSTLTPYEFTFDANQPASGVAGDNTFILGGSILGGSDVLGEGSGGEARASDAAFENNGQIAVATQAEGVEYIDTTLWPISRNDYAMLPNKFVEGRPSVYWFNRAINPTLNVWATAQAGSTWGLVSYRMIEIQDADPTMGRQLDMPRRAYPAFVAELTAALAEKFKPEVHVAKLTLAGVAWDRFANADRERVSTYIVPSLSGYFR